MLAGELALAGVDVVIVERRPGQDLAGSRAGGSHSRTIEVLDQRGIAERFLEASRPRSQGHGVQLDISDFPTTPLRARAVAEPHRAHPGRLVRELGVPIRYGSEVTGLGAGRRRRRPACGR